MQSRLIQYSQQVHKALFVSAYACLKLIITCRAGSFLQVSHCKLHWVHVDTFDVPIFRRFYSIHLDESQCLELTLIIHGTSIAM